VPDSQTPWFLPPPLENKKKTFHTQQIPTELLRPQIYYHPISTKKETRRRRKQTRTDPKLELSALDLNQKSSSSSNFSDQS
jgi:hypothetical protein